jgi:hypothetical protein
MKVSMKGGENLPDLITQLEYNDPLVIISRKGDDQDPYVRRTDSLPIINGCITLFEIPSTTKRVQISDMLEVDQSYFEQKNQLAPNEFLVHYQTGMIQFHPSLEGTTKLCTYYGKGLIMYPASRIYAMISRNPDVVVTLQDYIDEIELKLTQNTSLAEQITASLAEMKATTQQAKLAIEQTAEAIDATNEAAAFARDAYLTTKLVWKEPVQSDKELYLAYPHPNVGWTVQTTNDGKRYRFDGSKWVLIDIFGSNLQTVNEHKDGLMSVAEHLKLKSYPSTLSERVVVMSLPDAVQGVIVNNFSFPYEGEIVEVYASCATSGETPTIISIEKTRNMVDWTELTDRRLTFPIGARFDDKQITFKDKRVAPKDIFRVNMIQQGLLMDNLTITFRIKT